MPERRFNPGAGRALREPAEEPTNGERTIRTLEEEFEREGEDATRTLGDVQRRLQRAESEAIETATITRRDRAARDLEEARIEAEARLAAHSEQLRRQLEALEAETEVRLRDTAEDARRQAEEELRRELADQTQAEVEAAERRLSRREQEIREEARAETEARIRAEVESDIAERIEEMRAGADRRADEEIEVASRAAEQKAAAARDRLDELAAEIESAGKQVEEAESRLADETLRIQEEAEARSRERIERAEERARRAEASLAEAETERIDHQVSARTSAAEWLRGQTRAIHLKAEAAAKDKVSMARRQAVEKVSAEADARVTRERERAEHEAEERTRAAVAAARREIETEAERRFAEREQGLADELEQAGHALRTAERRLREAEERAADAESRLAESAGAGQARASALDEARYRELTDRIGTVRQRATQAAAHAAAWRTEPPQPGEEANETPKDAPFGETEDARLDEALNVNEASFDELRRLGMSVTQATRVIAYRQRQRGFDSLDDLDTIPGFPEPFLAELKRRLTAAS